MAVAHESSPTTYQNRCFTPGQFFLSADVLRSALAPSGYARSFQWSIYAPRSQTYLAGVRFDFVQHLRRKLHSHGLQNTLDAILLKALNRVFVVKILRGVCVEEADASFLKVPENYHAGF